MEIRNPLVLMVVMLFCFQTHLEAREDSRYKEIPVGMILDMGSRVGKIVNSCISMAVSDFYTVNSRYKTRMVVHNRDTHGEPLHALSAALDLLKKLKVQAVIGAESMTEAMAALGDEARVPLLSLSPAPSSNKHPYYLQITPDETTQFKAIAAMAESFGWKKVIIVCEDTDNGRDMATFFTNLCLEKSIFVTYTSLISPSSATNELIQEELHKFSTMQTNIYIMHTCHSLASLLFLNAKFLGMMGSGYKWIITSKTLNFLNFTDDEVVEAMQGALGFKSYIPKSKQLHKFTLQWRKEYHAEDINIYAIWVYDAISALAMAVERIQSVDEINDFNIKDFGTTGLTQRGPALLNQILRISFDGLGGAFQFIEGRITADALEIINVIGKEEQRVGFWTMDAGFTKRIRNNNSSVDAGLETIIWPGGITSNPTHSMLNVSRKNLRIGVPPFDKGRLLQVDHDAQTNLTVVSGFCAEVFLAAFSELGLNVDFQYELVTYFDIINRVHAGELDVAIGDITITANRSLYVDFTFPYTDLGLAVLSRNADASMWIFIKPLSSDLWIMFACFFVLLGITIWILEHKTNEEFQGSPTQQFGTTFWFAFSTLVYAHRENLQSNLSRFVVNVWLFVVLVLVSTYTATLSSLLTIEQIKIASKSGSIGYQYLTPIEGTLVRNMNITDTRLKPFLTFKQLADALSRGSKNGGVDAIVNEIPYIKDFLADYPSGYSMTVFDATTNGFGFAFPQGSPLAHKMSSQIAKLRENGTLKALENKWFNPHSKDSEPGLKIPNLKEFRGLFLISGGAMAAAVFLYTLYFIHEKLHFRGKLAFIMRFLMPRPVNAV